MTQAEHNFIELLALAVKSRNGAVESPNYSELLALAQAHGMANLLYYGVAQLPTEQRPTGELLHLLKQSTYAGAAREAMQEKELQQLFAALTEARLRWLPLKGCLLKRIYPKPEMRHMSDVDLLIDPADAEQVRQIMTGLGWRLDRFDQGNTDLYFSPIGFLYEVHRDLAEEGCWEETRAFCAGLLQRADAEHRLSHEDHFAYLLCHFVKHLLNGGIGVRQVLDLYLYRRFADRQRLQPLLEELKLAEFDKTLAALERHWFEGVSADAAAKELGDYVLGSGVFGKDEQRVADRMLKERDKRSGYVLHRLFPPYLTMKFYFPVLKNWPILLPVFWVWRILRGIFSRGDKLRGELDALRQTDQDEVRSRAAFYRRCGLRIYEES